MFILSDGVRRTGIVYIVVVGRHLLPERVRVDRSLVGEFEMAEYLTEVAVANDSPLLGKTIATARRDLDLDVDVVQLVRDGHAFAGPLAYKQIRRGDLLVLRTGRDSLLELIGRRGWNPSPTRTAPTGSSGPGRPPPTPPLGTWSRWSSRPARR